MSHPQKGINAEPNLHAIHLMFHVVDDNILSVREKLARLLSLFEQYENECYEAMVTGTVGIGTGYWLELYREIPKYLMPFPDFACDERDVAVLPVDLIVVLRSDRLDVCYELSHAVCNLLHPSVELLEQVNTFRFYDGRDLNGFLIAPFAPMRQHKMRVSVVGDEDPVFKGGSYLHLQRFNLDVTRWSQLSLEQQENIKGYTKLEGKRTNTTVYADKLLDMSARFIQHTMPFGDINTQGILFLSCAKSPQAFHQYLEFKHIGDGIGGYDLSCDYESSVTGAAFFAPSIDFIKQQGAKSTS